MHLRHSALLLTLIASLSPALRVRTRQARLRSSSARRPTPSACRSPRARATSASPSTRRGRRTAPIASISSSSEGFFDDQRFFRVIPQYIAQFGASAEPKDNDRWDDEKIPDDPRAARSNSRGTLSFAAEAPNTQVSSAVLQPEGQPEARSAELRAHRSRRRRHGRARRALRRLRRHAQVPARRDARERLPPPHVPANGLHQDGARRRSADHRTRRSPSARP